MDFIGGVCYTNGRANDPIPGTVRSGHHERANAQEVAMNVAYPPFRGDTSPETSPDHKGQDRGASAVSAYPERDSNPHAATQQGVLSHFSTEVQPAQNDADTGVTASALSVDRAESVPNTSNQSPEVSPDIMGTISAWKAARAVTP